MTTLLAVGGGGALGAMARWLAGEWVQGLSGGDAFPWGTLAVNVAGAFLLGLAMGWFQDVPASPEVRQLVTVGFLGSFTTFSTYSYETVALARNGELGAAVAYSAGSVALGLVAVLAGAALARAFLSAAG